MSLTQQSAGAPGTGRRRSGLYVGSQPHPLVEAAKVMALAICCLVVVGPFIMVLSTSFADEQQIGRGSGLVLWPEHPTLEAYRSILSGGQVSRALAVSAFVTVVGTLLALTVTALLAYALSQRTLVLGRTLLTVVVLTLFFSPGMIPSYLTVKQFGLLDSLWSLIVPVSVSAFNVVVMRAFFQQMPADIAEAARVDGASETRIFWSIILPLSKPVLAAIGLFYAVGFWNSYFSALLYINDTSKWPIQLILRQYLINNEQFQTGANGALIGIDRPPAQSALQMATLVISIVPIACIYPFLQRHFTRGMLSGAIKG